MKPIQNYVSFDFLVYLTINYIQNTHAYIFFNDDNTNRAVNNFFLSKLYSVIMFSFPLFHIFLGDAKSFYFQPDSRNEVLPSFYGKKTTTNK